MTTNERCIHCGRPIVPAGRWGLWCHLEEDGKAGTYWAICPACGLESPWQERDPVCPRCGNDLLIDHMAQPCGDEDTPPPRALVGRCVCGRAIVAHIRPDGKHYDVWYHVDGGRGPHWAVCPACGYGAARASDSPLVCPQCGQTMVVDHMACPTGDYGPEWGEAVPPAPMGTKNYLSMQSYGDLREGTIALAQCADCGRTIASVGRWGLWTHLDGDDVPGEHWAICPACGLETSWGIGQPICPRCGNDMLIDHIARPAGDVKAIHIWFVNGAGR